ncbi:MAG: hypothetical protein GY820_15940 [Gammaproteobacteria bacterium]|nr:hypothetical protein [Gammaproteobacteria bacterium]
MTRDAYIDIHLSAMENNCFGLGMLNQTNPPKCTLKPLLFAQTHRLFPARGVGTF